MGPLETPLQPKRKKENFTYGVLGIKIAVRKKNVVLRGLNSLLTTDVGEKKRIKFRVQFNAKYLEKFNTNVMNKKFAWH